MVAPLRRVMVCTPSAAGWDTPGQSSRWRELGFLHRPEFSVAQAQHVALCRELEAAGAEVDELLSAAELTLDAVYTHDASLASDFGLIVMRPGKANRVPEARWHSSFCKKLGLSTLGEITAPG